MATKIIKNEDLKEFKAIFSRDNENPSAWESSLVPFLKLDVPNLEFSIKDFNLKLEFQRIFAGFFDQVLANGKPLLAQKLLRQFAEIRKKIKNPGEEDFPIDIQDFEIDFYSLDEHLDDLKAFEVIALALKKPQRELKNEGKLKSVRKQYEEALANMVFGKTPEKFSLSYSDNGVTLHIYDKKTNSYSAVVGDPELYAKFQKEEEEKFYPKKKN